MTEDEQATGGYVIAGEPYIIGDDPRYWTGWCVPDGFEITNEIHAPTKEDLVEAAINHFRAVIRDAEKEQR